MNDACPALYTEPLFLFAPALIAAVTAALLLLTHWVLGFPRDSKRRS
jgi:hypothetical protein